VAPDHRAPCPCPCRPGRAGDGWAQNEYADVDGRARRCEYWFFVLFIIIVSVVANALNKVVNLPTFGSGQTLFGAVASLALLLTSLSVAIRRLRDTGRSCLWFLYA
jgi:uncharacterized membrane protein YhaH (DUF805 family)